MLVNQRIASTIQINVKQVTAVLNLLNEGATIPFIARYRKEVTGSLDEVAIETIDNEQKKLIELKKRKTSILDRLEELKINKPTLIDQIKNCYDAKELEDLYLPYKQKRKTKASVAKEQGLEPLAKIIMSQRQNDIMAQAYRFARNGLSADEALEGARHIMAEWISESSTARNSVRTAYERHATLVSKVDKKREGKADKYKDYFDFSQSVNRIPSHRFLAILRAEKDGLLKVKIEIDSDRALERLERIFIRSHSDTAGHIKKAVKDSYKRLISPSIETEIRKDSKTKADIEAIGIFANNLGQLLMAAPLGSKHILALDPGFRTGCKLTCLDEQSELVHHSTIYPHPPQNQKDDARHRILGLISKHNIKAIAIGNGTAGRETEQFIKNILPKDLNIEVYLISEAGASIYSASEAAREEFPELDLTVRGSISIGRRLIDPLAELVKIEPKNIGVGQYQHDVDQNMLKSSLDNVVSFAVNKVGVNVNTASKHLLQHVAGLGPKLAQNIVDYRNTNGSFKTIDTLKKVKGYGAKAYEQSAGFLRIVNGNNPLDSSAVHPESYALVNQMASRSNLKVTQLIGNEVATKQINIQDFVTDTVGLPTLTDIISELKKPGLDPRGVAKTIEFDDRIRDIKDVRVGMTLQGKITNLTKFGAFVDIGVKENGLIHISQISDNRISDPAEVLSLEQVVTTRVIDVDLVRKRIALSMKA
ncbi:MAG: RNA-binding transcriptional accessory protein [Bacteroidetes bacterium]|nr:MAG: RNA-binding transcriptional accessory protein [Bacteroidota bacterium]